MNIVNVGYDSTNYYVIGPASSRLLVDVGFPGTLPKLRAILARKDIPLRSIRYLLATHYHPDHAGLAQEIKQLGIRLIVLDTQTQAIPLMKQYMKPEQGYIEITLHDTIQLSSSTSRSFLQKLDIAGTIISTPGHSDDSVTLVLDTGQAFTGDLPRPSVIDPDTVHMVSASWDAIQAIGGRMIYPGHGPSQPLL
jgi:endoribonuclease LACTB2